MTAMKITAKLLSKDVDEEGKKIVLSSETCNFDFGDNLKEASELFGADIVFSQFRSAGVVNLQSFMRGHMRADEPVTGKALQKEVGKWKPDTKRPAKSKVEAAKQKWDALDETGKAELKKLLGL